MSEIIDSAQPFTGASKDITPPQVCTLPNIIQTTLNGVRQVNEPLPAAPSRKAPSHGRRPRPTASNPIFGHIEGVYRGEAPHCKLSECFVQLSERTDTTVVAVHRGHMLPKHIDDRDKCQKIFLETANSILTRVSRFFYFISSIDSVLK